MEGCCKNKEKRKIRKEGEKRELLNRLNRIEGQLRGIRAMIEEDKYCIDIITQISAARAAMGSLSNKMLTSHLSECVSEGIKNGDDSVIKELAEIINKCNK